ncbi:hypothetical protein ST201phi2-1p304 [Pseudomonas phage 201phi2-1]|uniref:Uncharacterized protein n=1 Tax=Pseudomonas phage 201phi2-1 TaxID=198110 RepID=B3FJG4_BP201|nr:hypothetical protein ST201phi2-1p304 [Pseudomonas phage 201phi2-1]ABY63130.1 hypothetical protein 201phi2-1p304 [Pseudomonas phage 201phi2-1]
MDKSKIIETVKAFCAKQEFPIERLVLGFETAAVMHGLQRGTGVIHAEVDDRDFEWVWCMTDSPPGRGLMGQNITVDGVTFHVGIAGHNASLIDGVMVVSKTRLWEQCTLPHIQRDCVPAMIKMYQSIAYELIKPGYPEAE